MASHDLAGTVRANWLHAFGLLAQHVAGGSTRRFGPVLAAFSRTPIPFFNELFALEDTPTGTSLEESLAWARQQGCPFAVTTPERVPPALDATLRHHGLVAAAEMVPGMVLSPIGELADPPASLEVERVHATAGLEAVAEVSAEAFEIPPDLSRTLTPASLLDDADIAVFLGRRDGDPVACAMMIRSGATAGVYNVAVTDRARRRGFGAAMSAAAVRAGAEAGCTLAVLQASEMGLPVYERMGFEIVDRYRQYVDEGE